VPIQLGPSLGRLVCARGDAIPGNVGLWEQFRCHKIRQTRGIHAYLYSLISRPSRLPLIRAIRATVFCLDPAGREGYDGCYDSIQATLLLLDSITTDAYTLLA